MTEPVEAMRLKITLCGTIACIDEMRAVKQQLEADGHLVQMPPDFIAGPEGEQLAVEEYYQLRQQAGPQVRWVWKAKDLAIGTHFLKIQWADLVLVVNGRAKGIDGYVGINTTMEVAVARFLHKPLAFLYPLPDQADRLEEFRGIDPQILNGRVDRLAVEVAYGFGSKHAQWQAGRDAKRLPAIQEYGQLPEPCNNGSVGVLVTRRRPGGDGERELLLIERLKVPYGFAPPAGHPERGETAPVTAEREVGEEVGLRGLVLSALSDPGVNGHYRNACRRPGGGYHFWLFYEAEVPSSVRVSASPAETKSHRWVTRAELQGLADLTAAASPEEQRTPGFKGLEPVWCSVLSALQDDHPFHIQWNGESLRFRPTVQPSRVQQ